MTSVCAHADVSVLQPYARAVIDNSNALFTSAQPQQAPKQAIAKQTAVGRSATTDKPRTVRNLIILPIVERFTELKNPAALFVAAKNRIWSVTHFRLSDSASETAAIKTAELKPIEVTFGDAPSYQLLTPTRGAMSQLAAAYYQDSHPGLAPDRPLPLVRNSTTQLNMRVNDAVSLLWEVDRSESAVEGSEVGLGIGFKVAF